MTGKKCPVCDSTQISSFGCEFCGGSKVDEAGEVCDPCSNIIQCGECGKMDYEQYFEGDAA